MTDGFTSGSAGIATSASKGGVSTAVIVVATAAALMMPAAWNGFPFVFHDTGGYLAAFVDRELAFGRSAAYGALLAAGRPLAFWPSIAVQAVVATWIILLTLRHHGVRAPAATTAAFAILILATSLPWYAAQLMPDLWVPLAALAIYLLAFRATARMVEKLALVAVAAFAIAGHMATLALAGVLLAGLTAARVAARRLGIARPALAWPTAAVLAGIVTALGLNLLVAGELAFTPGSSNFLFARLVHTGIAADYLAQHCPDPDLELCRFRHQLPTLGEDWLWEPDSPLNRDLGGWEAFAPEARRIVADSLRTDPLAHIAAALAGTAEQFVTFETGDGLVSWTWNTHHEMERLAPQFVAAFKAARQQQDGFDLSTLNTLHLPIGFAALLSLPAVSWAARRQRVTAEAATFAGFVLAVLIGNALICGALSIPHGRYQSRVIWLAPLAVAVAWAGARRPAPATPAAPIG